MKFYLRFWLYIKAIVICYLIFSLINKVFSIFEIPNILDKFTLVVYILIVLVANVIVSKKLLSINLKYNILLSIAILIIAGYLSLKTTEFISFNKDPYGINTAITSFVMYLIVFWEIVVNFNVIRNKF